MIYIRLFLEFFRVGLFAVGGGLATLPFLYEMSRATGWFAESEVADMLAISESTPGAIGVNMATYAGYQAAGFTGGLVATLGLVAPSIIVILLVARFLDSFQEKPQVMAAFYGLRPASTGLVASAGCTILIAAMIRGSEIVFSPQLFLLIQYKAVILGLVLFFFIRKTKRHPVFFIAISAVVGMVLQLNG